MLRIIYDREVQVQNEKKIKLKKNSRPEYIVKFRLVSKSVNRPTLLLGTYLPWSEAGMQNTKVVLVVPKILLAT